MPLSLNEIKSRAVAFSKEWENEANEDAEAKSFWDGFFNIFGVPRRRVASFEQNVRLAGNKQGYIDLLWKGVILVEHKSRGKDLQRAYAQAKDYFPGLKDAELPRYILVSDFERFHLYDLDSGTDKQFRLNKLVDNLDLFDFLSGYKRHTYKDQDPVNIAAAELMGKLHDELKANGYDGHQLELYLVRLLFCLFADDTNIFEKGLFFDFLDMRTREDGADLAGQLAHLFEVLNTDRPQRQRNLDELLAAFPYVNGRLFEERLPLASFDSRMRRILLDCSALDWSAISPAIFGSLFQSVMDEKARRNLGAHYTSEKNIMKLIKPLFLDELEEEFKKVRSDSRRLDAFHIKLSKLRFIDPACGCGNFLIIAYRELRLLEIEVLRAKFKNQMATNIDAYVNVNVDQFYGIEYEEFPAQIAQVAMWLIDHQMNIKVSEAFGEYFVRLPLRKSATIVHGNALRIDWQSLIQEEGVCYDYILGNPPFYGAMLLNDSQREDVALVFSKVKGAGVLDYVSCWYYKAAELINLYSSKKIICGFVSTNSITQGEQVGILWQTLLQNLKTKIHFAHRTFKWSNEAKGNAAVHVVIIGFSNYDRAEKKLYYYDDISSEPAEVVVGNINPYLVAGKDILITNRKEPISNVPKMVWGSQPRDGGNLLLDEEEKNHLVKNDPTAAKYVRKYIGGYEIVNNVNRYCLWLVDAVPEDLKKSRELISRIDRVRAMRLESKAASTRKFALTPTLFAQIAQPESDYLALPEVSSERRLFLPINFFSKDVVASNTAQLVPNATLFHFGILVSTMHMSWVKYTCGRLKSDFRYSNSIVYNNYPWPENPSEKQVAAVEKAAQAVLDARAMFPNSSLADLYDPLTMPPALVKAHQALDKAVDLCYRPQPFASETKRIEYLFELYDKYTAGLFVAEKKTKKKAAKE